MISIVHSIQCQSALFSPAVNRRWVPEISVLVSTEDTRLASTERYILTSSEQHIGRRWVPGDGVDALLVSAEFDHRLDEVLSQTALRDEPDL